jgi:hypothetical protein
MYLYKGILKMYFNRGREKFTHEKILFLIFEKNKKNTKQWDLEKEQPTTQTADQKEHRTGTPQR